MYDLETLLRRDADAGSTGMVIVIMLGTYDVTNRGRVRRDFGASPVHVSILGVVSTQRSGRGSSRGRRACALQSPDLGTVDEK